MTCAPDIPVARQTTRYEDPAMIATATPSATLSVASAWEYLWRAQHHCANFGGDKAEIEVARRAFAAAIAADSTGAR